MFDGEWPQFLYLIIFMCLTLLYMNLLNSLLFLYLNNSPLICSAIFVGGFSDRDAEK